MVNRERYFTKEEIMGNPTEYAIKFSEGNKQLENLLNYCYSNNISTRACCIGHENDLDHLSHTYISFEINENEFDMFSNAVEVILTSMLGDNVSIQLSKNNDKYVLNFSTEDIKQRNIFFNMIKNTLSLCNTFQISDNVYLDSFHIFEKLINSCEKENSISLQINKNNIKMKFAKEKYIEKLQIIGNQELPINNDNTNFLNYLESLNRTEEFNVDNINNSYILSGIDIEKISNYNFMDSYTKR